METPRDEAVQMQNIFFPTLDNVCSILPACLGTHPKQILCQALPGPPLQLLPLLLLRFARGRGLQAAVLGRPLVSASSCCCCCCCFRRRGSRG